MELIFGLPPWGFYSLLAVVMTYWISVGGWVLARAGRSPLWVLLLLLPWVNVVAIWLFAYARWPAFDDPAPIGASAPDETGSREVAESESADGR